MSENFFDVDAVWLFLVMSNMFPLSFFLCFSSRNVVLKRKCLLGRGATVILSAANFNAQLSSFIFN